MASTPEPRSPHSGWRRRAWGLAWLGETMPWRVTRARYHCCRWGSLRWAGGRPGQWWRRSGRAEAGQVTVEEPPWAGWPWSASAPGSVARALVTPEDTLRAPVPTCGREVTTAASALWEQRSCTAQRLAQRRARGQRATAILIRTEPESGRKALVVCYTCC